MIDEPLKEQASLYVVGALPPAEARVFEEALQHSLELQLWVGQLRDSAEALASSLPRRLPSPALRARLLAEVDRRGALTVVGAAAGSGTAAPLWLTLLPWAMAACLAFLCVVLASRDRTGREEVFRLEQRLADAVAKAEAVEKKMESQRMEFQQQKEDQVVRMRQQAVEQQKQFASTETRLVERIRQMEKRLGDPVTRIGSGGGNRVGGGEKQLGNDETSRAIVPAAGVAGGASAPTVLGILRSKQNGLSAIGAISWDILAQRGLVVLDQLTPAASDRDYQLWLIVENTPVNAGILKPDASGRAQVSFTVEPRLETVDVFAITLEAKGGAPTPQGAVQMASN